MPVPKVATESTATPTLPTPVATEIRHRYGDVISNRDMALVNARLHHIAERDGLGVAVLVAWQHGLAIGHIPVEADAETHMLSVPAGEGCPYTFVHVPVRSIRGDNAELIQRGIMNPKPELAGLVSHDDAPWEPGSPASPSLLSVTPLSPNGHSTTVTPKPCYLCSVAELTPHEASFVIPQSHHTPTTSRDYAIGFTFAPFGDPAQVCHFLAWDSPRAGEPVLSMEPTGFSTTDLITLTSRLNDDIAAYCARHHLDLAPTITGVCNHWAGNTIAHQHYQFFSIPAVPLLVAARQAGEVITAAEGVRIRRVTSWPAAAYVIEASPGADVDTQHVGSVADRFAASWDAMAPSHTQNTVAYRCDGADRALVIPRDRHRTTTSPSPSGVRKHNAGVLEMLGYFLIDDAADQHLIADLAPAQRTTLGDQWLTALTPPPAAISRLESHIRTNPPILTS